MIRTATVALILAVCGICAGAVRNTVVDIHGSEFWINGSPTYKGRVYKGMKVEGLLLNARMVQGIFDDLNPATRARWNYPDGPWDPDRNTREFVAAMSEWRRHGLVAFTINLQGGSPEGYSKDQPWHNSAFDADGKLRPEYMGRLEKILDKADELGMAVIVGYFYFGQEYRIRGETAVNAAVDGATDWLLARGYTHVLVEVANETNHGGYQQAFFRSEKCDVLVRRIQERSRGKVKNSAGRLLVSTSFTGGVVPPDNLAAAADFLLLHGNGVKEPAGIARMVERCRALRSYHGQPILFNEDDHFDFDRPQNHLLAAVGSHAGWGYFDYRMAREGFNEGYQSVPVDWAIRSGRKRGFFTLLSAVTGQAK